MSPLDVVTLCARIRAADKADKDKDFADLMLVLVCGTAENIAEINQSLTAILNQLKERMP